MGGPAKRVWKLDKTEMQKKGDGDASACTEKVYDKVVVDCSCTYAKRMHNIILDNCHSHVAMILNELQYEGRSDWNQISVFWGIWRHGKWVSRTQSLLVFIPFLFIIVFVCIVAVLSTQL